MCARAQIDALFAAVLRASPLKHFVGLREPALDMTQGAAVATANAAPLNPCYAPLLSPDGRIEVRAQLPQGDFLWPAIW
jgi:hypothetical protein